ncbi:hypothetical protein TRFO_07213 [Tritrichomonas foetus]|uniref:Uncharacterized protein n=1 Tax=Tritrichomonas foetus TaxID=1144522 RepID=A0A1J4JTF8_9EUKA|nr:hypothetical protein TRFO_07213 [Tritrichomonas foetus]|eukprot:OHT02355.1 hypothetical protein TRFO_07213 [Tritrichomonas foetus]
MTQPNKLVKFKGVFLHGIITYKGSKTSFFDIEVQNSEKPEKLNIFATKLPPFPVNDKIVIEILAEYEYVPKQTNPAFLIVSTALSKDDESQISDENQEFVKTSNNGEFIDVIFHFTKVGKQSVLSSVDFRDVLGAKLKILSI